MQATKAAWTHLERSDDLVTTVLAGTQFGVVPGADFNGQQTWQPSPRLRVVAPYPATFSVKANVEPAPGALSAQTRPPCASTNCLTMAKPNPEPPVLRVRDLSER